jgi:hypothetical protein
MSTQKLQFYTLGKEYTALLHSFFREGSFTLFETLCKDGNFTHEQLRLCFELKLQLEGDSRDPEGMSACFLEKSPDTFKDDIFSGISSALGSVKSDYELPYFKLGEICKRVDNSNIETLLKYFTQDELTELLQVHILESEGYSFSTLEQCVDCNYTISGLLLRDGRFIKCPVQGHVELWPIVVKLGLAKSVNSRGDAYDGDAIVISSDQLHGVISHYLRRGSLKYAPEGVNVTIRQLEELWKVRDRSLTFYGERGSLLESVRKYYCNEIVEKGGKFGNLQFLNKFYPEVKTCTYDLDYNNLQEGKLIVRTSPKYSLPGLLNSININSVDEVEKAVTQIKSDFETVKDVLSDNEIHWFFQEYLEGQNGVVNCMEKPRSAQLTRNLSDEYTIKGKYDIEIAVSDKQGAIVLGESGNAELSLSESKRLRHIVRTLAEDLKFDIQLEFVKVAEDDIRVVQLRTLPCKANKTFNAAPADIEKASYVGQTFSTGYSESTWYSYRDLPVEDVLVVEQDGESSLLLGKKALIVQNGTTFSHLLALSKALKIPSICNTGPVDLSDCKTVTLNVQYTEGLITKNY